MLVTGDTPVIDVIERLAKDGFLFVIENGDVTGVVSYKDLFGPLGSLCLLALTFELEGAALRLCRGFSIQCCDSLPEGRLEKALEVFKARYNSTLTAHFEKLRDQCWTSDEHLDTEMWIARLHEDVLNCTTFIDKCKMINSCKLLADWSASKVKQVFARAERVRNACAHPPGPSEVESVLKREQLAEFVRDCRLLTESILMVTPQAGAVTDST